MRIIVPVKQVPDMNQVKFSTDKGVVDRSAADTEINPFDLYALEAAVRIKEALGGTTVTAISMGPRRAETTLRDALARGADNGLLLTDKVFAGADTLATSYTLACAIRKLGDFDLVICGEKTVDGDTGQVGPGLAEHLNIPHVAYVSSIRQAGGKLVVVCDMESESNTIECPFPVLITVSKDVNVPRLPGFRDKATARKAPVPVWGAGDLADVADANRLGVKGSPTRVHRISVPSEAGRKGKIFRSAGDGAINEIAGVILKNTARLSQGDTR